MAGSEGLACPVVQCVGLSWRCPGRKPVTGSVDPSGTGSVRRCRARGRRVVSRARRYRRLVARISRPSLQERIGVSDSASQWR